MKTFYRVALAAFFAVFFPHFASAQEQQCGPVDGMAEYFLEAHGERIVFEGASETEIFVFLVNDEAQTWTIVIHDGIRACMVASGVGVNMLLPTGQAL